MPSHYDDPLLGYGTGGPQSFPTDLASMLKNQLLLGGAGIGLNFLGNIFGGDGGQGKRIKEAQGVGRQLFNTQADYGQINQQRDAFQRGILTPYLNRLGGNLAGRVGLDSGVASGALLSGAQDLSSEFETTAIRDMLNRVLQQRLSGANILNSLAR